MSPRLLQILPEHLQFGYIGRPERAASGEGYPIAHATEQHRIVATALDLAAEPVLAVSRASFPGERWPAHRAQALQRHTSLAAARACRLPSLTLAGLAIRPPRLTPASRI